MANILYSKFDLPTDGQTRVEKIDGWQAGELRKQGWSVVGIAAIETKGSDTDDHIFGVFRMTSDEAVSSALEQVKNAEKARDDAQTKAKAADDARAAAEKLCESMAGAYDRANRLTRILNLIAVENEAIVKSAEKIADGVS